MIISLYGNTTTSYKMIYGILVVLGGLMVVVSIFLIGIDVFNPPRFTFDVIHVLFGLSVVVGIFFITNGRAIKQHRDDLPYVKKKLFHTMFVVGFAIFFSIIGGFVAILLLLHISALFGDIKKEIKKNNPANTVARVVVALANT